MSFSSEVKEEIANHMGKAPHCKIAEIAGLFAVYGRIIPGKREKVVVKFSTENLTVARKYFILVKKAFDISMEGIATPHQFQMFITNQDEVLRFLKALKIVNESGDFYRGYQLVHELLIQRECCKRAFVRGMFLASGSVTNPNKGYHLEFVAGGRKRAEELQKILHVFQVDAKIVERKKTHVVYLKEGSQIVDILNVMEAHISLMKLENVRIVKEMRNSINRQVNCETANIKKTVSAATKQIDDILYIRDHIGFGSLSKGLEQIATLRITHSEASLKELGEMLDPPIGKSGVNHRLRKLSEMAEELRLHKEEKQ